MEDKINLEKLNNDIKELQEIMSTIDNKSGLLTAGVKDNIYQKILQKTEEIHENLKNSNIKISGFNITFSALLVNSSFSINFEFK